MKLRALDPLLYDVSRDLLHAESGFVDRFHQLIANDIDPPYAVSIDGLWGSGKTTLMAVLQKKLSESGHPVFWFNPWEYRQTDNVVMAFLQCLAGKYENLVETNHSGKFNFFRVLLQSGLSAGLKLVTKGLVTLDDLKKFFTEAESDVPEYLKYKNTVAMIRDEFRELIRLVSRDGGNKPVVVFFDDLDRCLPEDTIQILEAVKNLFVIPDCPAVFICGIDTRIAKQFIIEHYKGIGENFSINYFRKIFNLTISMPYGSDVYGLLFQQIKDLYDWDDPDDEKAKELAGLIYTRCLQAQIYSVRKYMNVVTNFYTFMRFNPEFVFVPNDTIIVDLMVLKEAWQPLYEEIIQEAFRQRTNLAGLIGSIFSHYGEGLDHVQKQYLKDNLVRDPEETRDVYLTNLIMKYIALV